MYSIVEGTRNLVNKVSRRFIGYSASDNYSSFASIVNSTNEYGVSSRSNSVGYTELMGGSVPCPSCKGSGRIPKGRI